MTQEEGKVRRRILLKTKYRLIQVKAPVFLLFYIENNQLNTKSMSVQTINLTIDEILEQNPGCWVLHYPEYDVSNQCRVAIVKPDKDYLLDEKELFNMYKKYTVDKFIDKL